MTLSLCSDLEWIARFSLDDFRTVVSFQQDQHQRPGEYLVCRVYPKEMPRSSTEMEAYQAARVALSILWSTPEVKLACGRGLEYYFVVENDDILAHSITQQTTRLFALFVNLWTREFFAGQSHMVPRPELAAEWAYENWVFATMPNVKEFIRSVAVRGQKMTLIDEIRNEIDDRLGDNLETFSCDELETLYANMKGEHPSEMKCFMWLGTQIVRSVDAAERRGRKKLDLDYACQGASMSMDDFNTGEIIVVDDGDILVMHTDVTDAALWTVSSNIEKDQRSVE